MWEKGKLYYYLDLENVDSVPEDFSDKKLILKKENCEEEISKNKTSCFQIGEGVRDIYRVEGEIDYRTKFSRRRIEIGFYHFSYSRHIKNQFFSVDPFCDSFYLKYNFGKLLFFAVDEKYINQEK